MIVVFGGFALAVVVSVALVWVAVLVTLGMFRICMIAAVEHPPVIPYDPPIIGELRPQRVLIWHPEAGAHGCVIDAEVWSGGIPTEIDLIVGSSAGCDFVGCGLDARPLPPPPIARLRVEPLRTEQAGYVAFDPATMEIAEFKSRFAFDPVDRGYGSVMADMAWARMAELLQPSVVRGPVTVDTDLGWCTRTIAVMCLRARS